MSPRLLPDASAERRRFMRTGAAALAGTVVAGPRRLRADAPAYTVRFSHVVAEETPKGLAARRFQALVQEQSAGRIGVQIYPGGSLYGDHDEVQALQLGAVEILAPSLSKFGRIGFPEFELFDLPYLFPDLVSVRRITQGPLGQQMLARLSRQRLVGLGYLDNGFKHMSANRPLLEPHDYVGQRMRIQASRVLAAQMRALRAKPVTLAFSETRRALAQGVVDGTENPISNFWTQRMQEVQTHLTLTQHGYLGYAAVASQRFLNALPQRDALLIREAMSQALTFGNQIADVQNANALADLRTYPGTQIHVPAEAQTARLRTAVHSVHEELSLRIGSQWLERAHQALNSAAS